VFRFSCPRRRGHCIPSSICREVGGRGLTVGQRKSGQKTAGYEEDRRKIMVMDIQARINNIVGPRRVIFRYKIS